MFVPLVLVMHLAQAAPPAPQPGGDALAIQVMLDRAGFSPGPLDGRMGANTRKALAAYTRRRPQVGTAGAEAIARYRILEEDAAGPFIDAVPDDLMQQSALPALGYTSIVEMLAERFHATPALLRRLNPGAAFKPGDEIAVPNVDPMIVPPPALPGKTTRQAADVVVTVAKGTSALTVTGGSGEILLYAPVTTGSEHDPLPVGEWKVTQVQLAPKFHYNPNLFWDADPAHTKATIPAGPNNPVGLVWVDISKEHYGIHGTPEPATIGRTESHGCVRLTNWDALRLAALVKPGTRVVFTE